VYQAKYFKPEEFRCHGPECRDKPDPVMDERLLQVLDHIRETVGKPIIVTCGYRCPVHNRAVGGAKNSFHCQGVAADLSAVGIGVEELARIAVECGADGVGRYFEKNFVHIDVRQHKARWDE
jgi:uncharacterized protein YcbK (DUF882 family)